MSTDDYVPSEDEMRHAYRITRLLDHHADVNAAFDRFIARVRRDAAREALDGLLAHAEGRVATDDLTERIAEELYYEQHPEGRHRSEWPAAVYPDTVHEYRELAAAVLPIVEAEAQAAKAEAWGEGHSWGWSDAQDAHEVRQVMARADWPTCTPNPYKENPNE